MVLWFIGSALAGLVVHELGHVLAAGALGGDSLRLRLAWPVLRIDAKLPDGPGYEVAFLLAGVLANLGGAGALFGMHRPQLALLGLGQLVVAGLSLLPFGESDGSRLLALWRAHRRKGH